jgi:hypothetical protein
MELKAVGREGMDWIHFLQDSDQWLAVVNTQNVFSSRAPIAFSRRIQPMDVDCLRKPSPPRIKHLMIDGL